MAGDQLSATTQYYYQNAVTNTTGNNLTTSIVTALIQSIPPSWPVSHRTLQLTVTAKGSITYTYDGGGNKLLKTTVDNMLRKLLEKKRRNFSCEIF